jgi:N-acetylmuramoyl-L-alanine amidase
LRARARLAAAAILPAALGLLAAAARAQGQEATLVWQGQTARIAATGGDFKIADAAKALGFDVAADATTGVLTLTGHGHKVLVGAGTAQVPVDQRLVSISRPAQTISGAVYAPPDFFEKVLFPLVGASGSYDAVKRVWTLAEAKALTIDVAVVHVEAATQVVLRQSGPAKFASTVGPASVQVRWPDRTVAAPFAEKRYEDPFVSAVRFSEDGAAIALRDAGLSARAYALTAPDRVVVEVTRAERSPGGFAPPAPPAPLEAPPVIVIDPGHGGTETGAIGPGGLQEKQATLEIAKKLAATIPRSLACRVVLTRDVDGLVSLDDRTSTANHEHADLFLSIHANSSRLANARGSETYYLSLEASDKLAQEVASRENETPAAAATPSPDASNTTDHALDFVLWDLAQSAHLKESSELAEAIQEELNGVSGTESRGIKQAPFRVLVGATMPAVLIETAFISNPDEEKKLASPEFQQNVADAVSRAVVRFFARRRPAALASPTPAPSPTPTAAAR